MESTADERQLGIMCSVAINWLLTIPFSPLIGLEKILSSAIIQIRGMFHDKKGLHSRIQRTDIKGIPGGWECFACR